MRVGKDEEGGEHPRVARRAGRGLVYRRGRPVAIAGAFPIDTHTSEELVQTALEAAEAAARVHDRFAGTIDVSAATVKAARDFVSQVDIEAQRAALAVIRTRHPHHAILAEEDDPSATPVGSARPDAPTWIVDPLDGTTNYLHGHPQYAASVAVAAGDRLLAGAVLAPATGERWWAAAGKGAWKGTARIGVSNRQDLATALVGTGFPFKQLDLLPDYLVQFDRVLRQTTGIRRGGSAALDLCYLAQGSIDAFWELELSPWDVAAGALIVQEAGGVVARLDGRDLDVQQVGSVLAANSQALTHALGGLVKRG